MDLSQLFSMMQHYMETKKEYPDCILFYRLGDFYEMFLDDALTVSKKLEITFTGKDCGLSKWAPMCGAPFHAVDSYLYRLVQKEYRVTIAEQVEDPKQVRDLVKRGAIWVVTPGTITSSQVLDETKNSYLMGVVYMGGIYGISTADTSTGDFMVTEADSDRELFDEINKFSSSEIICDSTFYMLSMDMGGSKNCYRVVISSLDSRFFDEESYQRILIEHSKAGALAGLGLKDHTTGITTAGAMMQYIYETQRSTSEHITIVTPHSTGQYMVIDTSTRGNLELVGTIREKQRRGALLWVLDKTKTAMGTRLPRACIERPLIHKDEVIRCQNAVEGLSMNYTSRKEICKYLNPIYDLERLIGRISCKTINPGDLITSRGSLEMLPYIKRILEEFNSKLLAELGRELDPLQGISQLIEDAIMEEPPITIREDGTIKDGYNQETNKLCQAKTEGKNWLAELEAREKERTGIKTLKIKFSKVFGYCFKVTSSFKDQVPDYYIRKQTLTNAKRFTTDELKQLEDIIMGAEEKLVSLEYGLFYEVRDKVGVKVIHIQKTAKSITGIDVSYSLSVMAIRRNYMKPSINDGDVTQIKNGHHPVVEQMMQDDMFMANDAFLDNEKNWLSVITGPNMAGKSACMCQMALIVLVAQLDSFMPAQEADIGICDRVFTRVGASDDLTSGQSTFMVGMTEATNIPHNATRNSLLVLDEVGRGISAFDGLSVAWTVIKHINNSKLLEAKTLFAIHYHELTELEGTMTGVKNYRIAVKEQGDNIVFLHKVIHGGANKSYGTQIARLAGVSDSAIAGAKGITEKLSDADITVRVKEIAEISSNITQRRTAPKPDEMDVQQLSFFDTVKDDDIIRELDSLELSAMTPLGAMNTLYHLRTKLKNRWRGTE